jgi:hypothetical protein
MNRTMCLIFAGLCIAGMVLIAGCTQETEPETIPAPTSTVELPTDVPEIPPAEETPSVEETLEQTGNQT